MAHLARDQSWLHRPLSGTSSPYIVIYDYGRFSLGLFLAAAGYNGVTATIWFNMGQDAPAVSNDVYGYLLRDPTRRPNYREATYATLRRDVAYLTQRIHPGHLSSIWTVILGCMSKIKYRSMNTTTTLGQVL